MAEFTTSAPYSQHFIPPDYVTDKRALMAMKLLGYNGQGQQNAWGKASSWLIPGHAIVANRVAKTIAKKSGASDAAGNVEEDLDNRIQKAMTMLNVGMSIGNFAAGNVQGGISGLKNTAQSVGGLINSGSGADMSDDFGSAYYKKGGLIRGKGKYNKQKKCFEDGGKMDMGEDIVMVDKETGKKVGEVSYGERIFDKDANKKMLGFYKRKDAAGLGEYILKELSTHPDMKGRAAYAFVKGGPLVKNGEGEDYIFIGNITGYPHYYNKKDGFVYWLPSEDTVDSSSGELIKEDGFKVTKNGNGTITADYYGEIRTIEITPNGKANVSSPDGALYGVGQSFTKSDLESGLAIKKQENAKRKEEEKIAVEKERAAAEAEDTERQRLLLNDRLDATDTDLSIPTKTPKETVATTTPKTGTKTKSTTTTKNGLKTLPAELKTEQDVKDFQKWAKDKGADLGKFGKDKDGIDGKYGSKTDAAWQKYKDEYAQSKTTALVTTDTTTRMNEVQKIDRIDASKKAVPVDMPGIDAGKLNKVIATDTTTMSEKPQFDMGAAAEVGMDLGRIIIGAIGASKELPQYEVPQQWKEHVARLRQAQDEGLPPEVQARLNNDMLKNYAYGVEAIRNTVGGSSSAAAVLAGLSGLSGNMGDIALKVLGLETEMRGRNKKLYADALQQDMNIDLMQHEQAYQEAAVAQQNYVQLAQAGAQQITDRLEYNKTYGKDSPYSKLLDAYTKSVTETQTSVDKPFDTSGIGVTAETQNMIENSGFTEAQKANLRKSLGINQNTTTGTTTVVDRTFVIPGTKQEAPILPPITQIANPTVIPPLTNITTTTTTIPLPK